MNGWISVHRKIVDNPIFDNPEMFKMWMWCLIKATHTEHIQMVGMQEQKLKIGQFIFGRKAAARELKLSESKVYRFLKSLEKQNVLIVEPNNKYSVITIVNYALYQDKNSKSEQQMNNKRTTDEQQMNTNNKVNKVNNENNYIYDEIFQHWNVQAIIKHKERTSVMSRSMDKALKEYTLEQIKEAIEIYSDALNSDFYFNHKYTLEKFLKQSNGVPDWIEEGSMYQNYMDFLNKNNKKEDKKSNWVVDAS